MENDNNYQLLIQTKQKNPIIRILRPGKDEHTAIEKQTSPTPTVMKAGGILSVTGNDDMGQCIISINKPGP